MITNIDKNRIETVQNDDLLDENEAQNADLRENQTFLQFSVNEVNYVVEIEQVREVIRTPFEPSISKKNRMITLRKKVLNLINLSALIDPYKKETKGSGNNRTVAFVMETENQDIALAIDSVEQILDIPKQDILPSPPLSESNKENFMRGVIQYSANRNEKNQDIIVIDLIGIVEQTVSDSNYKNY